ncbi:23S rRNA methyltransferase [Psychrosphaera saromensis]|uniref:23S rRNA methyltransferase n=1 Tax=Psychrosphaera saromensis TaxID=716813 RepID=A0A2S7UXE3_9GAMM|nr:RNA methyltransferase [Psychrosphaera saromensis]PQJ54398.1 23S rRNA methyltransferase [Psychrosphaera saromensis]GHB60313.1 23S rRNA methyltransferase [Psychrosphaera saromensis]GLQ14608.1 23S rRNA methyltransferase [Psychrosphaera saromensis]
MTSANTNKVTICLTNPKSPTNVGAVLRAAGCFGANEILYTGNRYDRAKKFTTDTQNINNEIGMVHVEDFLAEKPEGVPLICVDLVEGATPLPEFQHPDNAFYVFGPEDGSIKQQLIDKADHVVFMPTNGSLNLGASVNVVLYDRVAKSSLNIENDKLIRESRDANNRLKVK